MKKTKPYQPKRLFLETLVGYVEASRVKTLDKFTGEQNAETNHL